MNASRHAPWQVESLRSILKRYQGYADEWRAKGRAKEAEAMENIIALLKDGKVHDPRIAPGKD